MPPCKLTCLYEKIVNIIVGAKEVIVGILVHEFWNSAIECDEFISVMDIVSTKMTNTIATNVTKKLL